MSNLTPSEKASAPETRNSTKQVMDSNPHFTYAQAIGFDAGLSAKAMGDQFAGLSREEWRNAGDEYAHGYRLAFGKDSAK